MPFDINLALNVMYPGASAAYAIMNVPPPPLSLPPGYALVGPLQADPVRAAHAMSLAAPDRQRMALKMLAESSIFGLVAWNASDRTALVAIRGSMNFLDWIDDFDAVPEPWLANPAAGLVHMGFQLVYEHICASLRKLLTAGCAGVQRILVTGHSLGAAVAVLAAYDIATNTGIGVTPELYSLAGPRVGDPDFAQHFNPSVPVCERIVNFMDVVPQVPTPPLYMHVGQEVLVHGGFRPWDITYAHHLTTYLNGLQRLQHSIPVPDSPHSPSDLALASLAGSSSAVLASVSAAAANT